MTRAIPGDPINPPRKRCMDDDVPRWRWWLFCLGLELAYPRRMLPRRVTRVLAVVGYWLIEHAPESDWFGDPEPMPPEEERPF